jgi:hypothetical protein
MPLAFRPSIKPTNPAARETASTAPLDRLLPVDRLPDWVPADIRLYLRHTSDGVSFRELARSEGQNASTVLRKVRRMEERRDDPLLDAVLTALAPDNAHFPDLETQQETAQMTAPLRPASLLPDDATLANEARRILRRMAEPGAVLAFAADFDKAAVLREFPDGRVARTAVMERTMAQAFVLKGWITCKKAGKIASYQISAGGRAALKVFMGEDGTAGDIGFADASTPFRAAGGRIE